MSFPSFVKIVEVSPRDGLQNESRILPVETKIALIDQLSTTGLRVIEATSFVSPKWIPQLADHQAVYQGIKKYPHVAYPVLIPNKKGLEMALASGVKEIAVFTSASEKFSQKNTGRSVAESMEQIAEVTTLAKQHQLQIRGYLSCVLGCPYEGEIAPKKTAKLARELIELGCEEISLGDTIGTGTPFKTQQLIDCIAEEIPLAKLAAHFHNTYGQALANVYVALEKGIAIFDSSLGGIGGCPYAKTAKGNVATEEVLFMLEGMGIQTGVDLDKIKKISQFLLKKIR